ncbi:MAG: hypothetical protein K0R76_1364 [Alphaproteobacteria bacterium]|nr:hypothetical protein [Alphaproteobacteria bacterium]
MRFMTIFKKLKAIYERTLNRNKWRVASQTIKRQARTRSLFERHRLVRHSFPKVRHVTDRAKQECSGFRDGSARKLDPELEHPPLPTHAERP